MVKHWRITNLSLCSVAKAVKCDECKKPIAPGECVGQCYERDEVDGISTVTLWCGWCLEKYLNEKERS